MDAHSGISTYVARLPKAELHVHLQGAASVDTVLELSRRYPDEGLPQDPEAFHDFYRFTDFMNFIDVFVAVSRLVRTAEDLYHLAIGFGNDLSASTVRYAEVTVTADSHLRAGIEPDELADALTRGRRDVRSRTGVELAWVFDIDGGMGVPSGERTIAWAERHLPEGSIGFGLGGPEAGVHRSDYADLFRRAHDLGLHSVPHAGETVGPEQVWVSLDALRAERIGHGIAAAGDLRLMETLAERDIALEICPTSNLRTGAVRRIEEHPFPVLRAAGVRMSLNTDDPGMFGTDLNREYVLAHEAFDLDASDLTEMARESVRTSFAPVDTKARLLGEIDAYAMQAPDGPDDSTTSSPRG